MTFDTTHPTLVYPTWLEFTQALHEDAIRIRAALTPASTTAALHR